MQMVEISIFFDLYVKEVLTLVWPFKIEPQIRWRDSIVGKGTLKTLKSEMKRGSTSFRPPPAIPMAAIKPRSLRILKLSSFPLSYMPPRSKSSFRSAIGCCVPQLSTCTSVLQSFQTCKHYRTLKNKRLLKTGTFGIFMSSIKIRSLFPMGGPQVSLVLFSTLASRFLCRSNDVVLEEKLMTRVLWEQKERHLNPYDKEIYVHTVCTVRCTTYTCFCINILQKVMNSGSLGSARLSNQQQRPLYLHHLLQDPTGSCCVNSWH